MAKRPEVLIEKWFPVDVIGAESMRERGASSALPPLYFLHVWWARRPLAASRAAVLASVLPAWRADWPTALQRVFPSEQTYHQWFISLCGILGDPVAGRKLVQLAKDKGVKLATPPYTHKRAFTVSPNTEQLETLAALLRHTWGRGTPKILDSFAGGGSIPFEARRYGFDTYANELNPVAGVILRATLEYPFQHGPGLADSIRKYGKALSEKVNARLGKFFPVHEGETVHAYIWARTITCPYTGKTIALAPNWWLQKGQNPVAVRPCYDDGSSTPRFEILLGKAVQRHDPEKGTVKRGMAVSPWADNQPVDGDYIKAEAQAGRMGQLLYAVALKGPNGVSFRLPTAEDARGIELAREELASLETRWALHDVIPAEPIDSVSNYDRGHRLYGMVNWRDIYAPRQLLALGVVVEELRKLLAGQVRKTDPADNEAVALRVYMAMIVDGCAARNSLMAVWVPLRQVVAPAFVQHNFSIKWTFAEFDAARNLAPWVTEQVAEAYERIAELAVGGRLVRQRTDNLKLFQGSADAITACESGSLTCVCTDPPYYDNVMYAELSDYFYVWLKRVLGSEFPQAFSNVLTSKDEEAVANVARFPGNRKKREMARIDYTRKMAGAFREMHRALASDGVLTVMFTHKQTEAWDTLATTLLSAGFGIRASWPVRTEYEKGLHLAKKSGARSTILLVCRKRETRLEPVWWEDIKTQVKITARDTAISLEQQGLRGVDLYIATFGPTLAILSENWPVLTAEVDEKGEPKPLRPEVALDLARSEVVALRKRNLLLGLSVQFDKPTDWYIMAWDAFGAAAFPADEALKLALALDLDLERDIVGAKRLVVKKQASVVLQEPKARRKRDMVDPDKVAFDSWIDAAHTAMLLYEEDGAAACQRFLTKASLRSNTTFRTLLQALINVIPRTRLKGKFVRPEAEVLDSMRLAFFDDLTVPVDEELKLPGPVQSALPFGADRQDSAPEEGWSDDDEGDEEEDDED